MVEFYASMEEEWIAHGCAELNGEGEPIEPWELASEDYCLEQFIDPGQRFYGDEPHLELAFSTQCVRMKGHNDPASDEYTAYDLWHAAPSMIKGQEGKMLCWM